MYVFIYIYLYSVLTWVIENVNVNLIHLVSYNGPITSHCYWGDQLKQPCKLKYHQTDMIKLMKPNQIQQNYFVNTMCHSDGHHKQISTPFFYQKPEDKLFVNYKDGNDLLNAPKIITMIPYPYPKSKGLNKYLTYRCHVTESYLDIMAQTFLVDSMYLY